MIENETPGYAQLLESLSSDGEAQVIGVTGPPGSGKSTLVDALAALLAGRGIKVAVLAVDPSSPFHQGALLGDRIRMHALSSLPSVFVRSLSARGSLGGLHPKIIEITDLLRFAGYEYILLETVGVGQNEVEIASLADLTIVVLVPESGDDVQVMKSGIMEIADLFVVNKSDRAGADLFARNLRVMLHPSYHSRPREVPIVKTIATQKQGLEELLEKIRQRMNAEEKNVRQIKLLAEKAYHLIQQKRMQDISRANLEEMIAEEGKKGSVNLYQFIARF
jgi:LAO/AO transport system kinase